jgi:uncharacterized protein DUF3631
MTGQRGPEAPPQLEDGAELLDHVADVLRAYVVLPSDAAAAAVVLWITASHGVQAWNAAPRLVIKAPEKRCGKSRLLDLVEALCHRPIMTTNASPSAVYRSIGADPTNPPTLLIDESDAIFGPKAASENEDLRGLLNAGHQRGRPALRWDAGRRQLDEIETFAMVALAGIGDMPDTIEDRAVIITMRRRAPDEIVQPYRSRRDGPALHQLRDRVAGWVGPQLHQFAEAAPLMPVEDRAADTWEPLVAVADAAGGHWPETARAAVLTLTGGEATPAQVSIKVRLLMDCRTAFADAVGLPTATLLDRLRGEDEAPWVNLGKVGLTAAALARMLGEFGITSANRRWPDGGQSKGYRVEDFADSWARYCPPIPSMAQPSPAVPPSPEREPGTASTLWDGPAVPGPLNRPSSPPAGRRDGTGRLGASTTPAVCITCRNPLSYDDGTHTHPTCEATS